MSFSQQETFKERMNNPKTFADLTLAMHITGNKVQQEVTNLEIKYAEKKAFWRAVAEFFIELVYKQKVSDDLEEEAKSYYRYLKQQEKMQKAALNADQLELKQKVQETYRRENVNTSVDDLERKHIELVEAWQSKVQEINGTKARLSKAEQKFEETANKYDEVKRENFATAMNVLLSKGVVTEDEALAFTAAQAAQPPTAVKKRVLNELKIELTPAIEESRDFLRNIFAKTKDGNPLYNLRADGQLENAIKKSTEAKNAFNVASTSNPQISTVNLTTVDEAYKEVKSEEQTLNKQNQESFEIQAQISENAALRNKKSASKKSGNTLS